MTRFLLATIATLICCPVFCQDLTKEETARIALKRAGISWSAKQVFIKTDEVPNTALLENLKHHPDLQVVGVQHAQPEKVLANLPELPTVKQIFVVDEITDAGLAHLANFTNLTHLSLNGPKVTDKGLKHLEGMGTVPLKPHSPTDPCLAIPAVYSSGHERIQPPARPRTQKA